MSYDAKNGYLGLFTNPSTLGKSLNVVLFGKDYINAAIVKGLSFKSILKNKLRKAAEEGEINDEQFDFLLTIDRYKRENKKPFPTWTEVLDVIKAMGYRKVADPQSIHSFKEETELQPTG